jgi:hypothetical protein
VLTLKLLALELGALLLYAGISGRSVGALVRGDNTKLAAQNQSISSTSTSAS